ncbi:MAG: TonB-dependent receptor [Bacteroidota bacterium]|nr:TonB-dependent receptor [Bacteroidota bacterium]
MKLLSILFFLFVSIHTYSQKITGQILDDTGNPLPGATVVLYKKGDTAFNKTTLTGNAGVYTFNKIAKGDYLLKITNIGFSNYNSGSIVCDGKEVKTIGSIKLIKNATALKNVVVTTIKPAIEVKADKIVFNVENNITAAGLDGIDLLRRAPGVMIDEDDNISLAGKSGLQIYIDGRPSPLSGKDLTTFLRSLRSTTIEAIEIVNNPSAKYDAAGTGGIINIRLKKNKITGTNGTVNAEYQQGVFAKYNTGFSLNHRNDRINLYSNYSLNKSITLFALDVYRNVSDSIFDVASENISHNLGHTYKAGVDYFINNKSTIGLMADGSLSDYNSSLNSNNYIKYGPSNKTDRLLVANNRSNGKRNNFNYNLNYHYTDTSGRDLNIDANYGLFNSNNIQLQPNIFYDSTMGNVLSSKVYSMFTPSDINIYTLKADYEKSSKKGKFGIGVKLALINSDNTFGFFNHDKQDKLWYDSTYSNHFIYKENINAAYVTYLRNYKNFLLQIGLRLENTNTTGQSIGFTNKISGTYLPNDTLFKRKYTNLFPSASITLNKNPKNQFTLSYSRRINRPSYQNLNPFEYRGDEYGGFKGNPDLKPSFAHSVSITNVYHSNLITSIGYTFTTDQIVSLSDTVDRVKSFYIPRNLGKSKNLSFIINYSYRKKWYSLTAGVTAFYNHNTSDYGRGRTVDLKVYGANVFAQNDIKLGKAWTGSLSGRYNSPALFRGIMKSSGYFVADAAIQKILLKEKGTLRINFSDVFATTNWNASSTFAGQYVFAKAYWEPRQLRISFSYRFGNTKIKQARMRRTGIEDEAGRTNSSN